MKLDDGIDSGRLIPTRGKNPKKHLPRRLFLALIFVIAMMPLSHIPKKCIKELHIFKITGND